MVIDLSKTANQFFQSATTQHTNKNAHSSCSDTVDSKSYRDDPAKERV